MNSLKASQVEAPVHNPVLDSLRGLAILMVLVHHVVLFTESSLNSGIERYFFAFTYTGWIGVDLFFVLSGFLITSILLRTKTSHSYFKNFIARRAIRIFPLYFVFLFAFFQFAHLLPFRAADLNIANQDKAWYWTYLFNIKMALSGWSDSPLAHFWSLAVEEQFYLIWPLVVYALSRKRLVQVCCGLIIMAFFSRLYFITHHFPAAAYTLLPSRVDALAMGAGLAAIGSQNLSRHRGYIKGCLIVSFLGLAFLFQRHRGFYNSNEEILLWGITLSDTFFASIVAFALFEPKVLQNRILNRPWLRWFGTYSYGIYIFHVPVIYLTRTMMAKYLGSLGFLRSASVLAGVSLVAIVSLSLLSWHFIEAPLLKFKRYF